MTAPAKKLVALDFAEAVTQATGPGQRFETARRTIDGVEQTVFVNAPPSLRHLFERSLARGDRPFVVYEDEQWSFNDVVSQASALGHLLVTSYGVAKGDRVAIGMRNYPEWIVAFVAITSVGAISVPLNAWWTEDELDFALKDCAPKVLIADRERSERVARASGRQSIKILGVRLGDDLAREVDRWEEVLPLGTPMPVVDVLPEDGATILYTSGTTGRPKGAFSTHRAITQSLTGLSCRAAVERIRVGSRTGSPDGPEHRTCFILVVPLFHVTGLIPVMLGALMGGLKVVMMYRWDPDRALQLIERERVTNFVGVSAQAIDLLAAQRLGRYDTSSLVMLAGGGGPVPPSVVGEIGEKFERAKPGIGYGMTETNAFGPSNSGRDYLRHPTSTGRTLPTMGIEIRDDQGLPVPVSHTGEIWMKGPNIISGYWNDPAGSAESIVDGWLRSGDLGHLDDEGFLYVEDRIKDVVIRAGENIYCIEVESVLHTHPAVHDAAVFGVPHERLGEELVAAVVLGADGSCTSEDLRAFVAARLAPFKVPTIIRFVPELPKSAVGKTLKTVLREQVSTPPEHPRS